MAIAWSRISSKVIAHPPEADEACRRWCGNGRGRSGVLIPHLVAKRKQQVLGYVTQRALHAHRHAGHVSRARGQTSTAPDPHDTKEFTMPPPTRYAKKQAKARQRRRRTAQERLARDRRQAQQAAEALQQALDDLGLPKDLVAEIEGRLRS